MRRRDFIFAGSGSLVLGASVSRAQQPGRTYRLGVLGAGRVHNFVIGIPSMLDVLRKAGFVAGANLVYVERHIPSDARNAIAMARELVAEGVDVIVAVGPEATARAALDARPEGPVVMLANHVDIVEKGYAKSLARPGGGVTGINTLMKPLAGKQLELLVEAFPANRRIGVMFDFYTVEQLAVVKELAAEMQLEIVSHVFERQPYEWEAGFEQLASQGAQSLLLISSTNFTPHSKTIAALALRHRVPSMFIFPLYVDAGGLMSYTYDVVDIYRRLGYYAARILAGTPAGELPVEQPRQFYFTLNLRTAKALGVELPTSILLRADRVIE